MTRVNRKKGSVGFQFRLKEKKTATKKCIWPFIRNKLLFIDLEEEGPLLPRNKPPPQSFFLIFNVKPQPGASWSSSYDLYKSLRQHTETNITRSLALALYFFEIWNSSSRKGFPETLQSCLQYFQINQFNHEDTTDGSDKMQDRT